MHTWVSREARVRESACSNGPMLARDPAAEKGPFIRVSTRFVEPRDWELGSSVTGSRIRMVSRGFGDMVGLDFCYLRVWQMPCMHACM